MAYNIVQAAISAAKGEVVTVTFPNGKNLTGTLSDGGNLLTTEDGDRFLINPANVTYVKLPAIVEEEEETDDDAA